MGDEFSTATRRGLVLTLYSEVVLVGGLALFALFPSYAGFLLFAVIGSFLVGVPAAWKLWAGRHEFGTSHARSIRRGALAFTFMGVSLLLAFFQVTEVVPDPATLRMANLRAPWFFLGAALLLDAAAIWFLLSNLVADPARRWLWLTLSLAAIGTLVYAWIGWLRVDDYIRRSGGHAFNQIEALSYTRDFTMEVVRIFAFVLLAMRVGFWPALVNAIKEVSSAEVEAREKHLSQGGLAEAGTG